MTNERREIAAQFDADGNGMLDATERAAALAFLEANPAEDRGGAAFIQRGGPGGQPIVIGPDGAPVPSEGFGGRGGPRVFGGPPGAPIPTLPPAPAPTAEDIPVNEALRALVVAMVDEDAAPAPAEARALIVECIMNAMAVLPTADRQLLVDGGLDPSDAQTALFEQHVPGIQAVVEACLPQLNRVTIGGPGGQRPTETGTTGITLTPMGVPNYPGVDLYDTSIIRTIFVDFGFADWEAEMEAFYNTDVEIPVTATVDGVTYENVGARFRGNSSFMSAAAGLKRPMRLKFDSFIDGQAVEGYRTLDLLNGTGDPTFLRLALYSGIANQYIAAPQVNFVRVVVDGENWGVFANQQHFNRDFVADYFGYGGDGVRWQVPGSPNGRGGMEYLGDDIEQYRTIYEIDNQDNDASWNALIDMFQVLNETPPQDLEAALDPLLDIDGVLRFLALEIVLTNSDGYYQRASDYYIYLDPDGRFHVVPHDMNEGLANEGPGAADGQLDPLVGLDDATKPLRSRLLAVPQLRARYLQYVLDIAENALDWDNLGPTAEALHDLIAEDIERDTRKLYSAEAFDTAFDGESDSLRSFIAERRDYLLSVVPDLIAAIPLTAEEAAANAAALASPPRIAPAAVDAGTAAAPAATDIGTTVTYEQGTGPAGWTLAAGAGGVTVPADPVAGPAAYFAFAALTDGFGDNKLDQCVAIDAASGFAISYSVYAATPTADASGMAVRVNPTFFADLAGCTAAVAADDSDNALAGTRGDEDLDFALGTTDGQQWLRHSTTDDAALAYAAADIPAGSKYMRLSIRARDRSGLVPAPELRIAGVSVTDGGAELVQNPGFAATP